jgi:hypothetical protein
MRRVQFLSLVIAVCTVWFVPLPADAARQSPGTTIAPAFDAANFTNPTRIDNPYFPLTPGTTLRYEGTPRGQGQVEEVAVTRDTKTILGVRCVVVRDRVWIKGELEEDTFDWYAQDRDGNVWYMGEDASDYKNGVLVGHSGSWEAGVSGAQAGILMEAHPQIGDVYRQEFFEGEAEDMAEVVSLTESISVPHGAWAGNVLVTKEWSALEKSGLERKYYAPGVGNVRSETVKGGSEAIELVEIRPN